MDNMHQQPDPHQQETQPSQASPSTAQALPAVFAHRDIAELYEQGFFPSRMEAELADMLYQPATPAPARAQESEEHATIAVANTEQLTHLNCIALIQDGQVLPILDLA